MNKKENIIQAQTIIRMRSSECKRNEKRNGDNGNEEINSNRMLKSDLIKIN